jgi:DNA-binding NarL/FixJ family response regulator
VLLVDSNASVLNGLACLIAGEAPRLGLAGVARNSAEALEMVRQVRPDVVVLDVDLGREDGLDLLARLVDRAGVVVLTCRDTPAVRERALALGAIAFIHKAEPAEQLLAAIRLSGRVDAVPGGGGGV